MPSVLDYDRSLRQAIEKWEQIGFWPEDAATDTARGKKRKKKKTQSDLILARNPKNGYPVYQLLKKSAYFTKNELIAAIELLNETDVQLKTSSRSPKLILDRLILRICDRQTASK